MFWIGVPPTNIQLPPLVPGKDNARQDLHVLGQVRSPQ